MRKIYRRFCLLEQELLELLYPPRCPFCDRLVRKKQWICPDCRLTISYIKEPLCKKCGKPVFDTRVEYCRDCRKKPHKYTQGKAVWTYEEKVKKSVYRFKYQNKREYARCYAKEMADRYGDWICRMGIQLIVPIPLHKSRRRKRGYNQAEILAKELSNYLHIPMNTKLLVRVKNTKPQKLLNDAERKNNLKKAFKTTENIVQLKYILLVDDIYTTGSTLDAAAQALLDAGAHKLYACCISIGQDK